MARVLFLVLAVAGALWLIYQLRSVILLVILSAFFAYLLVPIVQLVCRPFHFRGSACRLSTAAAIGVVYLVLGGVLVGMLTWLVPRLSQQIAQMSSQVPAYIAAAQSGGHRMAAVYDRLQLSTEVRGAIDRALATVAGSVEAGVRSALTSVVELAAYLPWLVLIPILGFFLLKDARSFRRAVLLALPAGRARTTGAEMLDRIDAVVLAYIRAQLVACLLVGVIAGVGFTLLGMPYPVFLGVAAGLAEFVPMVGPFVIAIVSAGIAGTHAISLAVWVVAFLGVLRVVEDYVIYPRLVGHTIDLHPLAIILAVLAGAELGGVAGIFLSVPAMAVLSAVYRQYLASTGSQGLVADLLQSADEEAGNRMARPPSIDRRASG